MHPMTIQYNTGTVGYDKKNTTQHNKEQYHKTHTITVQYHKYSTTQYITTQYNTMPIIQCNAIRYNTIQLQYKNKHTTTTYRTIQRTT